MIQVYVLVSFWDENGLHKAGTFTEVKEENFDPYYMQKVDSGSVDAYTKAETDALLDAKQDDLTAGTNIQISDQDVISATDTGDTVTYDANIENGLELGELRINGQPYTIYGSPLVLGCSGIVRNLIDTQSYPGSMSFSTPVLLSDLEDALDSGNPVVFKFQDGIIAPDVIYKDVNDDEIRGIFTVGRDTVTGGGSTQTSDLKIITFQLIGDGERVFALFVDDATPSGGGGGGSTPTVYNVFDQYDQAMHVSDFLSSSSQTIQLRDSATFAVSFNTLSAAYLAGEVIISCGASGDTGDFKVISVVSSSQQMVTLLCGGSTGTVNRVVLTWQGDRWSKNVNQ